MLTNPRALVPYVLLTLVVSAVVWATSFGTLPPAEFTFCNGTEVESIDPARVNGQPEGRIVYAIFDGLYRVNPVDAEPIGVAVSPAGERVYVTSRSANTLTVIDAAARSIAPEYLAGNLQHRR